MNMAVSYPHLDQMQPWNDRLHLLECTSATVEAPEVMTFTFRAEAPVWFRYLPGQFVTLELPVAREPVMRTYTLSSSPSRPYSMAVTVKAQKDSIGTRWMFDNLKPGVKIRAYGPLGDFSCVKHPGDKYLFISAGSGVTPMMSMTRDMSDRTPRSDVVFINCARSPSEIIFRHELENLSRLMPHLNLGFIVEHCGKAEPWSGLRGMIDRAKISLLSPDFLDRTIFCCGPEPFMAAVRSALEGAGFDMRRYHQESFQPVLATVADEATALADGETPAMVSFALAGKQVASKPGETILMTARANGVRIGAACESGLCGTCRVMLLSGSVDMNHSGGILDEEIEEGYILACCSRPKGDIEIEV
ncbi:hybrid-cluster NAD(P)-dependent oxidoreductase [Rhizobium sp. 0TCS1.26]|uniref:2Fe-2S iron-sulfur cluster-binding protein n=1 Tax=Rhizobium sp. 0TCS1.26 TaxID=3142623 RepID=UPI003D26D3E8